MSKGLQQLYIIGLFLLVGLGYFQHTSDVSQVSCTLNQTSSSRQLDVSSKTQNQLHFQNFRNSLSKFDTVQGSYTPQASTLVYVLGTNPLYQYDGYSSSSSLQIQTQSDRRDNALLKQLLPFHGFS